MTATMARRTLSALAGSPRACSSITRSSMLATNVTPAALIACRSYGASSHGNAGARAFGGIGKHIGKFAMRGSDARGADRRDRIGEVQERARRRRDRRQVDEVVAAHAREHRAVDGRHPDTPDQQRVLAIDGKGCGDGQASRMKWAREG